LLLEKLVVVLVMLLLMKAVSFNSN